MLHHAGLVPGLVAAMFAVLAGWVIAVLSRWRQITWRDQLDTAVHLMPAEARVFSREREVSSPSLVLLRVRNSGFTSIKVADIRRPLTFTFPGRTVSEFAVSDCRGVTAWEIQPPGTADAIISGNRIMLPRFPMRRRASFKLLVLLSGDERGVLGKGRMRRGRVLRYSRGRGPFARNVVFGIVLAVLGGVQAGVSLDRGPVIPAACGSGPVVLAGSTAFAPVATAIGRAYTSLCPGASVSVMAISTFNGLNAVNNSHGGGTGTTAAVLGSSSLGAGAGAGVPVIAMSDGPAPGGYPALVGHPVAVIIFAVLVSKQAGVFSLTPGQLRGIYSGTITNWRQLNGADLPIRIVSRTSGSGTRRAFDVKVLGGNEPPFSSYDCLTRNAQPSAPVVRCEVADTSTMLQRISTIPGAIGYAQVSDAERDASLEIVKIGGLDPDINAIEHGGYPFWTTEYLYTYGEPRPGSPAAAFLSYVNSDTARDILRSDTYAPCTDRGQSLLTTLCAG